MGGKKPDLYAMIAFMERKFRNSKKKLTIPSTMRGTMKSRSLHGHTSYLNNHFTVTIGHRLVAFVTIST